MAAEVDVKIQLEGYVFICPQYTHTYISISSGGNDSVGHGLSL